MARCEIRIGTAGWAISSQYASRFPGAGTHLRRYALQMNCVEINSSFYRPHQRKTYERWAESTPRGFRFSVKVPKLVTHDQRLAEAEPVLDRFADEVSGLSEKLGAVLVQLPPSLPFEQARASDYFAALARRVFAPAVCEPRHRSWFTPEVDAWFAERHIARAAADPIPAPGASEPGGWRGLTYIRLHGSPRMYYSPYEPPFITALGRRLKAQRGPVWCVFDNTAAGAALGDALSTIEELGPVMT
jgi:uncharacterized protein YecE (DUF72 family)